MKDYEKIYKEFWKEIVENPDGSLNLDQVKRELADFKGLMTRATEVFMHVTGGKVSKLNTLAEVVISLADAHIEDICDEAVQDALYDELQYS
jgi:hypothetical protein